MLHSSDLGPDPLIIDDDNAQAFANDVSDPMSPLSGGYLPRDYNSRPFGSTAPAYSGDIIPRSQWDAHIERQDRDKSSPDHWRLAGNVPVLDQNGLPYCWCYGTVGAIMTAYAQQGLDAPHLSATGPAAQGKRWAKRGGWAEEALRYIESYGIPELSVWPEHSMDRSLPNRPEVQASAAKHRHAEFEELPRANFDALASVLLDPVDPRPVTLGLNWWGHLVYATKLVKLGAGRYGALIVNSWHERWGQKGTAVLSESKATAHEQIAVRRVRPIAA